MRIHKWTLNNFFSWKVETTDPELIDIQTWKLKCRDVKLRFKRHSINLDVGKVNVLSTSPPRCMISHRVAGQNNLTDTMTLWAHEKFRRFYKNNVLNSQFNNEQNYIDTRFECQSSGGEIVCVMDCAQSKENESSVCLRKPFTSGQLSMPDETCWLGS